MTFKPGDPKIAGRKAGTPNKRSAELRRVIAAAEHEIGGLQRLVAWIKADPANERLFWSSMFMRLLPVQLEGSGEHGEVELNVNLTPEEMAKRLEERGLPAIFGARPPPPPPGDPTLN
jgi:hypothetical protein